MSERRIGPGLAIGLVLWIVTLLLGAWLIRVPDKPAGTKALAPADGSFTEIVASSART